MVLQVKHYTLHIKNVNSEGHVVSWENVDAKLSRERCQATKLYLQYDPTVDCRKKQKERGEGGREREGERWGGRKGESKLPRLPGDTYKISFPSE